MERVGWSSEATANPLATMSKIASITFFIAKLGPETSVFECPDFAPDRARASITRLCSENGGASCPRAGLLLKVFHHSFGPGMHMQLLIDALKVLSHGVQADVEFVSDLLVKPAAGQLLEHFLFTGGE